MEFMEYFWSIRKSAQMAGIKVQSAFILTPIGVAFMMVLWIETNLAIIVCVDRTGCKFSLVLYNFFFLSFQIHSLKSSSLLFVNNRDLTSGFVYFPFSESFGSGRGLGQDLLFDIRIGKTIKTTRKGITLIRVNNETQNNTLINK